MESSDDELFDDDDSFADAVANLDNSIFETDSQSQALHPSSKDQLSNPKALFPQKETHSSFSSVSARKFEVEASSDEMVSTLPPEKALRLLKQFYGYSSFRHVQWEIIHCVTEER